MEAERSLDHTELTSSKSGDTKYIFDNKVTRGKAGLEVMSQSHPLIRFINANQDIERYHRLISCEIEQTSARGLSPGLYMLRVSRWTVSGAKTIEKLVYHGISFEGVMLTGEQAEKLSDAISRRGTDWLETKSHIEVSTAQNCCWDLMDRHDSDFSIYSQQMEMENQDQVDFRLASLQSHVERDKQRIEDTIQTLYIRKKEKMIKLHEGRIKTLDHKLETEQERLNSQRDIHPDFMQVMLGVCHVK